MKRIFYTLIAFTLIVSCSENTKEIETEVIKEEPDIKFGLDVSIRLDIFNEISFAEMDADVLVQEMYPTDPKASGYKEGNIDKNIDEVRRLQDESKIQIAKKYDISEDVLWDIIGEGVERGWNVSSAIIWDSANK